MLLSLAGIWDRLAGARGMRGGILLTILGLSLVGWLGDCRIWRHCRGTTGHQRGLRADFSAATAFLSVVFILFFLDFFDTTGTLPELPILPARTRRWQHRESGPCRGSGYGSIRCRQPVAPPA